MKNNMTLAGQGLAHPEASRERMTAKDFASLSLVINRCVSPYGFGQLTPERVEIKGAGEPSMGNSLTVGMAIRPGVSHA
ncbi:MAG: hypothetical protein E7A38_05390 [Leclercia adecarboxylata]|nr:hypothetical protein [Leclercia adecarboxylata]MDU1089457.1 hypothetical protein [Leclercia adecarboxylata]HBU95288.1 hypothetical protein [Leclercia adecarboxylata]HBX07670.1 hypothetical protein [Leclercia adecarboxylata]